MLTLNQLELRLVVAHKIFIRRDGREHWDLVFAGLNADILLLDRLLQRHLIVA